MPLPKSILCSACRKTYPEGWRRCPYCGHSDLDVKQESIARKFMQKKLQEFEQKFSRERKPPRPETRSQQQDPRAQQHRETEGRPGRGRRRRRRGATRPPAAQSSAASPPPPPTRPAAGQNQPRPDGSGGGGGKRRRFRRRRRGGGGGGGGQPPPTSQ
ncbi:MAG TPA: hypothetical protein VL284_12120 [Thermoanaerobaculia bacterium]|nr:hypothetical protein [Thermoanaerobaculia bacterium]